MFEIGWTELMLIGVVALIVIGPKDLPDMFRTLGRFTAKARSMARDFQRAMDQAANESGVKDMADDLRRATSAKSMGLDAVKDAASKFEKWDPLKPAAKPAVASQPAMEPTAPPMVAAAKLGPATQALADQKAARSAIAQDAASKLKRARAAPAPAPAKPVRNTRAKPAGDPKVVVPTVPADKSAPKPRAKRKPTPGDA